MTWLTHGVLIGQGPHIAANAPALLVAITTLVVLLRAAPMPTQYLGVVLATWVTALIAASSLCGVVAVALLATSLGLVKQVPQLWTALRGESLVGLSPRWALQCVANGRYGPRVAGLAAPVARRVALAA